MTVAAVCCLAPPEPPTLQGLVEEADGLALTVLFCWFWVDNVSPVRWHCGLPQQSQASVFLVLASSWSFGVCCPLLGSLSHHRHCEAAIDWLPIAC